MARHALRTLMVRVPGIEPGSFDWQPNVLPLNHTRKRFTYLHNILSASTLGAIRTSIRAF